MSDTSAIRPSASDAAAHALWQHKDNAACSQLVFHIAADQQRNADNDDNDKTARQVWVKLHEVYTNTSLAAQMALRAQLDSLTQQQPGVSIQDHSNQLLQLVDRLKACGETLTDKQLCGYFLSSLSAPYAAAVDMFKMMPSDRSPTYSEALKAFLSKETELKHKASETARSASVIAAHLASISSGFRSSTPQLNLAQAGQKRGRSDAQPLNGKHCAHCNKQYHDESECWHLHPELKLSGLQRLADKQAARAAKRQKELREGNNPTTASTTPALSYTSTPPASKPTARIMTVQVRRGPIAADVIPVVTVRKEVSPVETSPAMTSATGVPQWTTPVAATGPGSEWYLDSGASYHVCGQRELMTTYRSTAAEPVLAAGGQTMYAVGVGSVCAWLCSSPGTRGMDGRIAVTLQDVLFVPYLQSNLISVTSLLKTGNSVVFAAGAAQLQDANGVTWATASLRAGATLFSFWTYPRQREPAQREDTAAIGQLLPLRASDTASMVQLWHQRLNHLSLQPMLRLRREDLADGAVTCRSARMSVSRSCLATHVQLANLTAKTCRAKPDAEPPAAWSWSTLTSVGLSTPRHTAASPAFSPSWTTSAASSSCTPCRARAERRCWPILPTTSPGPRTLPASGSPPSARTRRGVHQQRCRPVPASARHQPAGDHRLHPPPERRGGARQPHPTRCRPHHAASRQPLRLLLAAGAAGSRLRAQLLPDRGSAEHDTTPGLDWTAT